MIISVINLKGGSGKTTTAMALATAAARHNRNVSVLDTDPQGDATTWAGNAVNLIRERGASVFDASVPKRVGMQKVIGHAFPSNLNGYEDVYSELEEAIA